MSTSANVAYISGKLLDKPQLAGPKEANLCLVQTTERQGKEVTQRIFCKIVGENASKALELEPGQHILVDGKLRYSKQANISFIETWTFKIL